MNKAVLRFDAVTALRVGLMMTDSLKVLHEMGFVHRYG